jgi:predicted AlkP superfamily phosphohydrolase/phosphomutase
MNSATLLVFDGLDPDLLDQYIDQASLPNFEEMKRDNRLKTLMSTVPAQTSPAAFCLYTGCNPGRNGPTQTVKPDGETPYGREDLQVEAVWDYLDREDVPFYVYNARFTGPPPEKGEAFVSALPSDAYPSSLNQKLEIEMNGIEKENPSVKDVEKLAEKDRKNIEILEDETDADFRLIYIGFTDSMQHNGWNKDKVKKRAYEKADDLLGEFQDLSDHTIVASDHGFHSNPEMRVHVNNFLEREGQIERSQTSRVLDGIAPVVKERVPDELLRPVWNLVKSKSEEGDETSKEDDPEVEGLDLAVKRTMPGVDLQETSAFCSTWFGVDCRENHLNRVEEVLKSIEYRGEGVVEETFRREEIYHGPYTERASDILFTLDPKFRASHLFSRKDFTNFGEPGGSHVYKPKAVLGFSEGLKPGQEDNHIWDVLPTALGLMGLEVSNLDGERANLDCYPAIREVVGREEVSGLDI